MPSHSSLDYDLTSYAVDTCLEERLHFCAGYELRRHKHEDEANRAIHRARQDWLRYIGPIDTFADANPYNGNFASLVLPFTFPDRVAVSAYFLEYAFLYDDICESANKALAMDQDSDGLVLDQAESVLGAKQMQSRIILDLFEIDEPCGQRIIDMWKLGMSTTRSMKMDRSYTTLEEYIPFRSLDTGAPFVLAIMLFGIGVFLTDEDLATLDDILSPGYAALGLANDYFSFDREYAEREAGPPASSASEPMTNAVWLSMQWLNLDVVQAKGLVRTKTLFYEAEYSSKKSAFLQAKPQPDKYRLCLDGLSQMIIGNVIWSLNCPRYHPQLRYDANIGIENRFLGVAIRSVEEIRLACLEATLKSDADAFTYPRTQNNLEPTRQDSKSPDSVPRGEPGCQASMIPYNGALGGNPMPESSAYMELSSTMKRNTLSSTVVSAPFDYCASNPSKEVRTILIDAMNVWIQAPIPATKTVKSVARQLHTASLLLDDIEDLSPLRRGKPAAHTVFGVPSTINSANFAILEATELANNIGPESLSVYFKYLRQTFIGQSYDLFWTKHGCCPSIDDYLAMIDGKTGGLFQLCANLLSSSRSLPSPLKHGQELERLILLLGRLYQVRDDLLNLTSTQYTSEKGSCEDLDEGKFSYPIIEALSAQSGEDGVLRNILATRLKGNKLSSEMKQLALRELQDCGALDRTRHAVVQLRNAVSEQLSKVEALFEQDNWVLRLLVRRLV